MSWDALSSFSRTNHQVWRTAESLPHSSHSWAAHRETLMSFSTAHKQDMTGVESQEAGREGGEGRAGTHCTRSRTCGSCRLHIAPPRRSTRPSGTLHTSFLLPSSASCGRSTGRGSVRVGRQEQGWGRDGAGTGQGQGRDGAATSSAPATVPYPHTWRPPTDVCCLHRFTKLLISRTWDAHGTHGDSTQQYSLPPLVLPGRSSRNSPVL